MKTIKQIREAHRHGWIDPDGKYHSINKVHTDAIGDLEPSLKHTDDKIYKAIDKGWARVYVTAKTRKGQKRIGVVHYDREKAHPKTIRRAKILSRLSNTDIEDADIRESNDK